MTGIDKKETGSKAEKQKENEQKKRLKALQKEKKRAALKSYPTVSLTKNALWYAGFFVFAFLFTQALRSPLSSVLFLFAMLLPPILFLYALTALAFVSDSNTVEAETVQKETPLSYELMLANNGVLPYPYMEADLRYPAKDGVHCDTKRVGFSLAPMGTYRIRDRAVFHYRGGYEIGICDVYAYDMLRLFRIRMRRDNLRPVFVMPRRHVVTMEGLGAASEINTTEVRNLRGSDRTELTEIREYQIGDGLRDIHWKLSSKTQDFMVKHYGMNACRSMCFLPDLGAHYTDPMEKGLYEEDINLCAADAVIEMTIARMLSALRSENNVCTLLWYDRRAVWNSTTAAEGINTQQDILGKSRGTDVQTAVKTGAFRERLGYFSEVMYNTLDFERAYSSFATAPLHDPAYCAASLGRFMIEGEGVSYDIVTSHLDEALIAQMQESIRDYSTAVLNGGVHVYCYDPARKIIDPQTRAAHRDEMERITAQLRSVGIDVVIFDSMEMFREG